jgi:hypothetical protein
MFFACFFFYCSLFTGLIVTVVGQLYTNDEILHKKFPNVSEEPITSTTSIKPEDGRRHLHEYRILHRHNT